MRFLTALTAAVLLAAPAAFASATPSGGVTFSAAAQKDFDETYGARDAAELAAYIESAIAKALAARGGAVSPDLRIETTLRSATPDHPTMQQVRDNVTMSWSDSASLGGADLAARIVDAQGRTVGEVRHHWRQPDLSQAVALGAWTSARRTIDRFAAKVAQEYMARR